MNMKIKRILPLFFLFALILNACSLFSSSTPAPTQPAIIDQIPASTPVTDYGALARNYMEALTAFGPRVAGTDAEARAAQYISDTLDGMGYSAELQSFSEEDDNGDTVDSANVVAVKSGRDAREIIVGAHYDSAEDGLGADDNASGVAVMLAVAGLVQNASTPYTIRFIAFGAEESGLVGSYAYRDQMGQDEFENTIAMINLDSVVAGNYDYIYSDEGSAAAIRDWALEWAFGNNFDLKTIQNVDLSDEEGYGSSDYSAFREVGIPYTYFESTDWTLGERDGYTQVDTQYGDHGEIRHTQYDTLEYLDSNFPGRVDQNLNLYTALLYNILTQFEEPAQ